MSRLLAVAARELRERWLLFPAALVLGCVPIVLPAFGLKSTDSQFVGLVTAISLGAAAAVIIGTSMLARDAANGRLGFLFSRPLPWAAVWGGKWLAAIVLVVSTGLLAAIPWMAAYPPAKLGGHHGDSWFKAMLDGPGSAWCFTLIVLAVGLANLSTVALRSRSAWLVVDGALLLGCLWATRRYVAPIFLYGLVVPPGRWEPSILLLPLVLALVIGSLAQVALGRTDLHRAHRAASLGVWSVLVLTLVLAAGYLNWALAVTPADVTAYSLTRDPTGRWVYLSGTSSRGGPYPHSLLVDSLSGRYVRRGLSPAPSVAIVMPEGMRWDGAQGAVFSATAPFCLLPRFDDRSGGTRVVVFDLRSDTPRARDVALESSPPPSWDSTFALSPAGRTVFMVHASGASLYETTTGRRLSTVTIKPGWRPLTVRFLAEDQARAWLVPSLENRRAELAVLDLALDGRSQLVPFAIPTALGPAQYWGAVVTNHDATRILTRDGGVHLRDGADGRQIATLLESSTQAAAAFLSDGRIVVAEGGPAVAAPNAAELGRRLTLFDVNGLRLGTVVVPTQSLGVTLGAEVAPGRILVSSFRRPDLPEDTLVVDLDAGRVVERLVGLRPAMGFWTAPAAPPGGRPNSVGFFRDVQDHVIRIDFATGERRTIAGPGAPRGERLVVESVVVPASETGGTR